MNRWSVQQQQCVHYAPTHILKRINQGRHRNNRLNDSTPLNRHLQLFPPKRRPHSAQREAMPDLFPINKF